jgi:hypothetical protein
LLRLQLAKLDLLCCDTELSSGDMLVLYGKSQTLAWPKKTFMRLENHIRMVPHWPAARVPLPEGF